MTDSPMKKRLPREMTAAQFGVVDIEPAGQDLQVTFTIRLDPEREGWQTGVALDASKSMMAAYGRGVAGKPPADVFEDWKRRGWAVVRAMDQAPN